MQDDDDNKPSETIPAGPPQPRAGYKAPFEKHQFQKGKSGNPRGRPKDAQGKRKIAQRVLLEEHEVVEGGRVVRRTALELLLAVLRYKAFEGDNRAFKALEKLDVVYDPQEPKSAPGYLVVPGRLTKESWVELFSPKRSFYEDEE